MIDCPCGKYQIDEREVICPYCGIAVAAFAATRMLGNPDYEEGTPRWGTARFDSRMNLILFVHGTDKQFTFDANTITELMIGRLDPDSGYSPPVDLHDCNGVEMGVSRRHAAIVRKDGGPLNIVDRNSDNGTYLNGQRLIANQARILRDGDELRLGYIVLTVRFLRIP
jgi:hypothetical protein